MKLLIVLTLTLSLCAHADFFDGITSMFTKDENVFTTHEEYSSNFCSKYEGDEELDYYVGCHENKTKLTFDLDSDLDKINRRLLEEEFQRNLKEVVVADLSLAKYRMERLKYCLKNPGRGSCSSTLQKTIESIRDNVPAMRIAMAQMDMPGKIFSPTKPERFDREPAHPITGQKIKPLMEDEALYLQEHTDYLENKFRNEVIEENPKFKDCKDSNPCDKEMIINSYIVKKFERENKKQRKNYNKILDGNPLLSFLNFTGEENDNEIIDGLIPIIDRLHGSLQKSYQEAKSAQGDDIKKLLLYTNSSEKILKAKNSRFYCDIHQEFMNDLDFDELKTDIGLVSASVIGGGLCALTAGTGCVLATAVGTEGLSYYVDAKRTQALERSFYSGLGDSEPYAEKKESLDRAGKLALLSFATEGLTTTNLVKRSMTKSTLRRIPSKLKKSNKIFNPENVYNLDLRDQQNLADISEILVKREKASNPNTSTETITNRVKEKIDKLIKECRGSK